MNASDVATQVALGAAGLGASAYGLWLLWDQGSDNLRATITWLVVGVIAHDAVLAPVVIVLGVIAGVAVPRGWRAAAAWAFVVLGTVTVTAIPVLGRFGERADNPTLLDRDYTAGWLVVAALTLTGALLLGIRQRGHTRSEE